jgi:hypothetical protein
VQDNEYFRPAKVIKLLLHYLQILSTFKGFELNWQEPLIPNLFQSSDAVSNTGLEYSSFDCAFPDGKKIKILFSLFQ